VTAVSYGERLRRLAAEDPDAPAFVCAGRSLTRAELDRVSNRWARVLAERGTGPGDLVTLVLPNCLEHLVATLAAWKLGAVPSPISAAMPPHERDRILEQAAPAVVVGLAAEEAGRRPALPRGFAPGPEVSDAPLPDRTPPHERALASGGSTGAPKLILPANPAVYDPETASRLFRARRAALVPGPLYHAVPFSAAWQAVLGGSRAVVMPRFDASECLRLLEAHRADRVCFVPTMMLRIWRLPEAERTGRDLSGLEFVMTGGAPCPPWLMRAWIEWLGPDVMHEAFGPSERIGGTFITGREWLAHPGSVGRPTHGSLRILDPETGAECPPGTLGEIYWLPDGGPGSTYRYVGARAQRTPDGYESVGDMGWVDEDGYLHLGDRRDDMLLVGGRNVYPAEVEAALAEHPAVRSSAVIGLRDEDLGTRVHAVVEVAEPVDPEALRAHVAERLVGYKVPRTLELTDRPLRDEAGKVRRSALRAERLGRPASTPHSTTR